MDHAVGHRRDAGVVGDQHRERPDVAVHALDDLQDQHARRGVQRARRLVAEQDRGPLGDRPGDRDALLFPAGQLRREVVEPLAETDQAERLLRRHRVDRDLGDGRDVLAGGQAGDEVVELEDEADVAAPELGQGRLVRRREVLAAVDDAAAGRGVEAPEDVEQGRLAAARGPQKDDELPGAQVEVDAPEGLDRDLAHPVDLGKAARREDRRGYGAGGQGPGGVWRHGLFSLSAQRRGAPFLIVVRERPPWPPAIPFANALTH